jgi:LSU ribosomal protein L2P
MGIKFHKPTSPGRRGMSGFVFEEITASTPGKSLLAPLKRREAETTMAGLRSGIKVVDTNADIG